MYLSRCRPRCRPEFFSSSIAIHIKKTSESNISLFMESFETICVFNSNPKLEWFKGTFINRYNKILKNLEIFQYV